MEFIVCYTYIMQMSRPWMYADKCSNEFIEGVRKFLIVAEANKRNNFMCCPYRECKNEKDCSDKKTFMTTCFGTVSNPAIMFGPSTEKEGL